MSFDGDDDYVTFGDLDEMDAPDRFTASMWFLRRTNRTDASNHGVQNVLIAQSSVAENDNFEIGTASSNVELYLDAGSSTEDTTRSTAAGIVNDRWHHLVLSYDGSPTNATKLYVDGALVREWTEWSGPLDTSAGSPMSIGIARAGSTNWGDLDGRMDEVRLSRVARDSNWVWACWKNQAPDGDGLASCEEVCVQPWVATTNGTPHGWLDRHGLVSGGAYEAADMADWDGDGQPAWIEYRAGTDPTNSASVFRILSMGADGRLCWWSGTNMENRPFRIYRSAELPIDGDWGPPYAAWPRLYGTNTWTDPDRGGAGNHYYRVVIPP